MLETVPDGEGEPATSEKKAEETEETEETEEAEKDDQDALAKSPSLTSLDITLEIKKTDETDV